LTLDEDMREKNDFFTLSFSVNLTFDR